MGEALSRYMQEDDSFYAANFSHGERLSVMRVIPVEESINAGGGHGVSRS
jgi:hypothetical protein